MEMLKYAHLIACNFIHNIAAKSEELHNVETSIRRHPDVAGNVSCHIAKAL